MRRAIHRVLSSPWGFRALCVAIFLPAITAVGWLAENGFRFFGLVGGFATCAAILGASFWLGYRLTRNAGFTRNEIKADLKRVFAALLKTPIFSAMLILIASIFAFEPLYVLNPELGDRIIWPVVFAGLILVAILSIKRRRSLR
jgi:hypothetical protein